MAVDLEQLMLALEQRNEANDRADAAEAKLEQAERERARMDLAHDLAANRALAAESALAAAQGALREARELLGEARPHLSKNPTGVPFAAVDDLAYRIDAALAAESGKPGGEAPMWVCTKCGWSGTEARYYPNGVGPWCQRCQYMVVSAEPRAAPPAPEPRCTTCGQLRESQDAIFCSNAFHLAPQPWPTTPEEAADRAVACCRHVVTDRSHDWACAVCIAYWIRFIDPSPAKRSVFPPHNHDPGAAIMSRCPGCEAVKALLESRAAPPALPAELSGKGEQPEPGEAKKEEGRHG